MRTTSTKNTVYRGKATKPETESATESATEAESDNDSSNEADSDSDANDSDATDSDATDSDATDSDATDSNSDANDSNSDATDSDATETDSDYQYPDSERNNFLSAIYRKPEFHLSKVPKPFIPQNFQEKYQYLTDRCTGAIAVSDHQSFLANFINPATPYRGLVVIHGTGSGKTGGAITVAENFKEQVEKYHTKIYIIVPGPRIKENWKKEIIKWTGNTYLPDFDIIETLPAEAKKRMMANGIRAVTSTVYRIMTYKQFHTKVIGQKIGQTVSRRGRTAAKNGSAATGSSATGSSATGSAATERYQSLKQIKSIDNSLLIVDEAHNFTGKNEWKLALRTIIKNSTNLKLLLLSATPMRNSAVDIVDMLNFIRPMDNQISKSKIFDFDGNGRSVSNIQFTKDGERLLSKQSTGLVSFYQSNDPFTFAAIREHGEFTNNIKFTKLVLCEMSDFQYSGYVQTMKSEATDGSTNGSSNGSSNAAVDGDDSLDPLSKKSAAVCNIVFPGLDPSGETIVPYSGIASIDIIDRQLNNSRSSAVLRQLIYDKFIKQDIDDKCGQRAKEKGKKCHDKVGSNIIPKKACSEGTSMERLCDDYTNLLFVSDTKSISGIIYTLPFLKHFSTKYYKCMKYLHTLYEPIDSSGSAATNAANAATNVADVADYALAGSHTAFVYSNSVRIGVRTFQEVLNHNGYVEYDSSGKYTLLATTRHYRYNITYEEWKQNRRGIETFEPSTYLIVTGSVEDMETSKEVNDAIDEVFNNIENVSGRYIKLLIGSPVMSEGITLENVKQVHVLEPFYHLGRNDQIVGRAVRHCKHYNVTTEANPTPTVDVYKYCVTLKGRSNEPSTEEVLYEKGEQKYALVKRIEYLLKQVSVDCPINHNNNNQEYDVIQNKECIPLAEFDAKKHKKEQICPSKCQFEKCEFRCQEVALNRDYYDHERGVYRMLQTSEMDWTTFNDSVAAKEITRYMNSIRDMYRIGPMYTLEEIRTHVLEQIDPAKRPMYDDFFIYRALSRLMPTTKEQMTNFANPVTNQYNVMGYISYKDGMYRFHAFGDHDLPNYYSGEFRKPLSSNINLVSFLDVLDRVSNKHSVVSQRVVSGDEYDFDTGSYYYTNHPTGENSWVGLVDKPDVSTHLRYTEDGDVFKIRKSRPKVLDKKRAFGQSTTMGSVCQTSMKKDELRRIATKLGVTKKELGNEQNRVPLCMMIYERLKFLERYATEDGPIPKFVYLIIPINHPSLVFPLNLVDRIEYIKKLFNLDFRSKKHTTEDGIVRSYKVTARLDGTEGRPVANHHLLKRYNLTYDEKKGVVHGILF
jgi:hypothetical protein